MNRSISWGESSLNSNNITRCAVFMSSPGLTQLRLDRRRGVVLCLSKELATRAGRGRREIRPRQNASSAGGRTKVCLLYRTTRRFVGGAGLVGVRTGVDMSVAISAAVNARL